MKSRSMRLSIIVLASLLVAGALLLAACGSGSTTTTVGAKSAAGDGTGTTASLTPKYGGTLRIAAQSGGANIGWPATMMASGVYVESYYETLLHSDSKGNVSPWLAESYKVADDQKSITFTIRKGVKFTDGSDLTADVVKWNLEQYAKSQSNWTSVQVVDPNTVRVNVKAWDNSLPATFGDNNPALYMVSKAAYDTPGHGQSWMITHPVGTGAFALASYSTDSSLKVVKNPNYWAKDAKGGKLPYLDGINFIFAADPSTTLNMAKAGEVDMVTAISPGKQTADYKNMGWLSHARYDSNEVWVPDSAHQDSPWSKLEVRQAAEYAVDRATIAKQFGYGYLQAPNQIPPRDATAYQANYALGRSYDPAKAKQLLAQAGYPSGFKTSLIVFPGSSKDIALAEQQYLAAVGIKADLQFPDFGKWNSYAGPRGTYHNALLESPDLAQGPTGLGCISFAVSQYGNNWQQPQELTQAVSAATSAPVPTVSIVRAATDTLTKNALLIPLYEIGYGRAEQSYVVADFGLSALSRNSFETAWLNK